mmetsp:Transcript_18978/g.27992  ORF Transcript_18978/g.27992 Transcript_18978/m.27992 type:complete len:217 (+) Transcript_18978:86-736(+)|eukprot:CAMPEP_0171458684 /NCGR_PEP_ID=MMETSP0945-20130129/4263_1 /TAXON_ID=109269 /ORGANISM="Vaucheria litorea, Strain CCMP2940" /LENGTH=216 /DNA_ID=CAMNT_0011984539 /DNA_START=32 /DNA_END=682 /DNA_ORIENTATION=-
MNSSDFNRETVDASLREFSTSRTSGNANLPIPPDLERFLGLLSKTGVACYSWAVMRELIEAKLVNVVDEFHEKNGFVEQKCKRNFEKRKSDLIELLRGFEMPPFTLQRLAEVLIHSEEQYKLTHKLMNGIEKLLSVTGTLPICSDFEIVYVEDIGDVIRLEPAESPKSNHLTKIENGCEDLMELSPAQEYQNTNAHNNIQEDQSQAEVSNQMQIDF